MGFLRNRKCAFFSVMCISTMLFAKDAGNTSLAKKTSTSTAGDYTLFNVNNISTFIRNNGSFNRNPGTGNAGFEWPAGSGKTAIYASGLWLGGKALDTVRVAIAEYSYEYAAGSIGGDPASSVYKMYSIKRGDNANNNADYANWPFDQGAPAVRKIDNFADSLDFNSKRIPLCLGDKTVFCVFNDADPSLHKSMHTPPLGAEIQLTAWAYNKANALGNTIFYQWRIINKSTHMIDSMYAGLWCDADVGGSGGYDFNGCDSTLGLGYTYNGASEPDYTPGPAVGFKFLQGPLVSGAATDVALLDDGRSYPGKKILPMTSYTPYYSDNSDLGYAQNGREVLNYFHGMNRLGLPRTDPSGTITAFMFSGDPTQPYNASTNWIETSYPGDRHFLMASGPFTMAAGDTQTIITANIIAQGTTNANSVTALKDTVSFVQSFFDLNPTTVTAISQ
jgi:hypothetical protein